MEIIRYGIYGIRDGMPTNGFLILTVWHLVQEVDLASEKEQVMSRS